VTRRSTLLLMQVFVDEFACIGCRTCTCLCPRTFGMEEEHGRARAFTQGGDAEEDLQDAIDSCPVSCIHWVSARAHVAPGVGDEVLRSHDGGFRRPGLVPPGQQQAGHHLIGCPRQSCCSSNDPNGKRANRGAAARGHSQQPPAGTLECT
jgi:ferredoxin